MRKHLFHTTALVMLSSAFMVLPASAQKICEKDGYCAEPLEVGKQSMDSHVSRRGVGPDAPPSAEYRDLADEIVQILGRSTPLGEVNVQGKADGFASGEHLLSDDERAQISKLVSRMGDRNVRLIRINGYADEQPFGKDSRSIYSDNEALSLGRADAAADYLRSLLADKDTPITTIGEGSSEPMVNCDTFVYNSPEYKSCLAPNRRIEVQVWYENALADCQIGQPVNTNMPFRVSIDGAPLAREDGANSADVTRCKDIALEKANVQLRFDALEKTQALNVTAFPQVVVPGEVVSFTPYSNYNHYITRGEVRIFEAGQSLQTEPLAIVALDDSLQQQGKWDSSVQSDQQILRYVLRVYDDKGRFDETKPLIMKFIDERRDDDLDTAEREELVGYGENHLAFSNIPVSGGIVTINGDSLAAGSSVKALGADIPVDANGRFAYRQILPAGEHSVAIEMESADGTRSEVTRTIYLPKQDWFYVGLADITAGKNTVNGPASTVTGDNSRRYAGDAFVDGRLAFYVKGKLQDGWQVTASADTKELPLEDLFSNFTEKDPNYLLKRLDPNKFYQVYGDDSTSVEDAQTQGKFYLKAEKDDSHVMWGNFQTKITGTDLLNYNRTLYGANAEYNGENTTSFGERRTEADVFAADPGSISSLEEFRGTGGSLYYLRGQDVVVGSEQLRIETRDRDSGLVLSSEYLTYGQDYEINYIQGRIILRDALSSSSTADSLVRTGALGGNPTYLVAGYEYAPSVADVKNLTKGGRVSHWFNDYLRLGTSAYDQNGSGLDQTLTGFDATVRYTPGTYLKIEQARSSGSGNGALSSTNGGFNFDSIDQTTGEDVDASAYRAEVGVNLGDLIEGQSGTVNAYTLRREDGYSAPGQLSDENITQYGFAASVPLSDHVMLNSKFDYKTGDETGEYTNAEINAALELDPEKYLTLGIRHDDRTSSLSGENSLILSDEGARSDVALKYHYKPLNDEGERARYDVYGLLQATLHKTGDRDHNNRAGVGGRYDITDRLGVNAEATSGNQGLGALLGLEYQKSDRTSYYANYQMDDERTDIGSRGKSSTITVGGTSRYTDSVSVFAEERQQTFDNDASSLIHSFGLDIAASDEWTWGGRFENGVIADPESGDTDRTAVSLTSGYHNDKTKYSGTIEYRRDQNDIDGDRSTWLMSNNLSYQTSEDWRMLADVDVAFSDSGLTSDLDADFIELGVGYAYRPVNNDRLNALVRYEYLSDLAPDDQLNATRTSSASDFEQRSHVVSADAIYDVTPKLAVGGKVGYRLSEIRDTTVAGSEFFDSNALLLVGRVDYHVVKDWEFTGEIRYLGVSEAEDAKAGALLAAYKHINQNVKVGVGYNFTDFSDDLTDLDYDSKGVFFNVVAKF
tara:strand:- start:21479 stop:25606 length:4128 start_codon:yes stop_codon:yes gene_type:complete